MNGAQNTTFVFDQPSVAGSRVGVQSNNSLQPVPTTTVDKQQTGANLTYGLNGDQAEKLKQHMTKRKYFHPEIVTVDRKLLKLLKNLLPWPFNLIDARTVDRLLVWPAVVAAALLVIPLLPLKLVEVIVRKISDVLARAFAWISKKFNFGWGALRGNPKAQELAAAVKKTLGLSWDKAGELTAQFLGYINTSDKFVNFKDLAKVAEIAEALHKQGRGPGTPPGRDSKTLRKNLEELQKSLETLGIKDLKLNKADKSKLIVAAIVSDMAQHGGTLSKGVREAAQSVLSNSLSPKYSEKYKELLAKNFGPDFVVSLAGGTVDSNTFVKYSIDNTPFSGEKYLYATGKDFETLNEFATQYGGFIKLKDDLSNDDEGKKIAAQKILERLVKMNTKHPNATTVKQIQALAQAMQNCQTQEELNKFVKENEVIHEIKHGSKQLTSLKQIAEIYAHLHPPKPVSKTPEEGIVVEKIAQHVPEQKVGATEVHQTGEVLLEEELQEAELLEGEVGNYVTGSNMKPENERDTKFMSSLPPLKSTTKEENHKTCATRTYNMTAKECTGDSEEQQSIIKCAQGVIMALNTPGDRILKLPTDPGHFLIFSDALIHQPGYSTHKDKAVIKAIHGAADLIKKEMEDGNEFKKEDFNAVVLVSLVDKKQQGEIKEEKINEYITNNTQLVAKKEQEEEVEIPDLTDSRLTSSVSSVGGDGEAEKVKNLLKLVENNPAALVVIEGLSAILDKNLKTKVTHRDLPKKMGSQNTIA